MESLDRHARQLAALADEVRRRMYLFVRRQSRPVSREEVADALGVSRKLAAFHLDKLADEGLLTFRYERPAGRSGPGAGRPAKVYERSDVEVDVSIPERRYDLLGTMLVDAVRTGTPGESPLEHATATARQAGGQLGEEVRRTRRLGRPGPERAVTAAQSVLEEHGFEPYRADPDQVALRNCPFHSLARESPELVCRMNQAFIDGLLRGLGNDTVEAALECTPGDCCVTLRGPSGA
jgi:predicted ArsR family transcriptional regulator